MLSDTSKSIIDVDCLVEGARGKLNNLRFISPEHVETSLMDIEDILVKLVDAVEKLNNR